MESFSTLQINSCHKPLLSNAPIIVAKYQEQILQYFDRSGILQKVQEAANKYKVRIQKPHKPGEYRLPFTFILELDLIMLTEISDSFSSFLLTDPNRAQCFIQDVLYCSVSTLADISDLESGDVQLLIRLKSLPALPGLVKSNLNNLYRLVLLQGILVTRTRPTKFIRSAVFLCPKAYCPNQKGHRLKGNLLQNVQHCFICGTKMKELCRARDTGDQVLGLVISPSALENLSSKKSVRHQSTLVCFQDELTTDLELGVRYNIPGLQTNEHFLAWNVQRWVPSTVAKIHRQVPLSFYLPPTISTLQAKLGEYCSHSPWALVATLAAQLASDLFPTTTLLHLKLGLLLSLATQGRSYESRPPVPILAVGSDYLIAHRLLSRVSVLANRCVTNGSSLSWGSLHGTAHHDEQGNCWLEAGYLLLASTGVCFLGDWAKYKSNNLRSAILSAIESGQVTIDTQMLPFSKSAVSSKFPLQCSVWTYRCWAPGGKEAEKTQLHTLINVFGMPYFADPDADADILAENILQRAIDTEKKTKKPYYIIPDQELQEYLTMVTTQPVKIGNKASKLIQDYFVASRRLRSHWLPVGAVSTITSLSVAHARLAMRQEVISADVAAVIYLYENSMRTLFGHSYVTPPPKPESLDISSLPVQVDNQMRVFTKWLDKHIKSLLGDSTYNTVPEE